MNNRGVASPESFWNHVTVRANGCWDWNGAPIRNPMGYGRLRVHGVPTRAHRHAYFLAFGPIPAGLDVLHRCDRGICVYPGHLFLGTGTDNMRDMAAKGRAAGFRRRGAAHPMAKLTQALVDDARRRWKKTGKYSNAAELAAELGIAKKTFYAAMSKRGPWA